VTKRRVLIVDDEPSLLRLLQVTLQGEGYEILLASDGQTALRRIREEEPDVVLLDVMMPVVDGWQVLESLDGLSPRPRVICLTAKTSRRDQAKGWRLGADDYLTKPFPVDRLIELMDEVLARSDAEQQRLRSDALRKLDADADTEG